MIDGDATNRLARMSSFASTLAGATKQLIGMAARLNTLSTAAGAATFQIQRLSNSAARWPSLGQAVVTRGQKRSVSSEVPENRRKWLTDEGNLFRRRLTKVQIAAARSIWPIARLKTSGLSIVPRMSVPNRRAATAFEILDTIADTMGAPRATVKTREVAGIGGSVVALRDETTNFIDKITAAVGEVMAMAWKQLPGRVNGRETTPDLALSRFGFASDNRLASATVPVVSSAAFFVQPRSVGFRVGNSFLSTAKTAVFATPMLVSPATADLMSERPRIDAMKQPSVTINSSPAITINASDCGDIEQRVLEALKKHREELYAQWCDESQRRRRIQL
jgi:hypothetical protein